MNKACTQSTMEIISHHYQNCAERYDTLLYFGEQHHQWVIELIIQALALSTNDSVIDLGGGTGFFSHLLYKQANLTRNVICVDPSDNMLQQGRNLPGVSLQCADAFSFIQKEEIHYDKILIKEAIHHIPKRKEVFTQIHKNLTSTGRLLIVTRPLRPELPFFNTATEAFAKGQPSYEVLKTELETSGFSVDVHLHRFPIELIKTTWFRLLRERFMSNLAAFTDEQIEQGIMEIDEKYHGQKTLRFDDILIFILGCKTYQSETE